MAVSGAAGGTTDGEPELRRRLGAVIRRRRKAMGLTLVQLAGRAELSHPFLSQLERGLVRPSMSSLHRIAQALGTSQPALMSQTLDPGDTRVGLVPAGEGMPVDNPGGSARSLVAGTRGLYPMLFEGAPQEFGPAYAHDGDEFIHVLSGTIEVEIVGEGLHTVRTGDTLYYPGTLAHRWRGLGDEHVRALFVQQGRPGPTHDPRRPG
ncbi:helix-turn-helix domain-containing protein [Pseudonocardia humida]|uniref:Helix-turn-helix transcriptional regulator n=1 Tax=Pseudonocardia humida TaxID=2800819 RepID=A0ABT0ZZM0_9PSEU|nr:XRE family transcriptional regulator [Pseudonocardia humida]MCO1656191.1 helix-turn-helix transcriptional regulator [Pseudonocardia humida]